MCKTRWIIVCAIVALVSNGLCHNASAQPQQTAVVRVDGSVSNPNPPGHGDDWGEDHAYKYLEDALAWAASLVQQPEWDDAQVWVAATDDPYRPTQTTDRTISFQLRDKVELYGGFAGNEEVLSARKIYENITVLSGDLLGDDGEEPFTNRIDNSYHVVTTGDADMITTRIDGFVITGEAAERVVPDTAVCSAPPGCARRGAPCHQPSGRTA